VPPRTRLSPLERGLTLFTDVRPGEGGTAVVLFVNVFLILCAYYLVKPLRDGWIAASEVRGLSQMELKAYASFGQSLLLAAVVSAYATILVSVLEEEPTRIPDVSTPLWRVIERALRKSPDERFATASELAPRIGQSFVVENKGGASGIPGAQACAQAAPDGYTLCLVYHNTLSINPLVFNKLPYDADKDFTLITNLYLLVEALFVSSALNVNSAAELKAYAQAHPAALNYGTLGPGSNPEMFLKWMNQKWNVNIVGIPYRGGGPIAQALAAGELQVAKMGLGNFLGLMETGRIKPLAVAAAERSPLAPDVPTLAQAGIDFPPFGWWGLAAPRGLPQPMVERLNAEFVKLYRDPKFAHYLIKQAVLPAPGSPAEFAAFLAQDRQHAEFLIRMANSPREDYMPDR
jgi:tripartite-type tricarboxylate transporter receptor subunit TctC